MHNYKIIPSDKVIIQILNGNITIDDLENLFVSTGEDALFSDAYSIVIDFRNSIISLSLEEIYTASLYYMNNCSLKGKRAILVNRSLDTAKLHLFRDQLNPKVSFSVFSTIDAASNYIGISLNSYLDEDLPIREDVYI